VLAHGWQTTPERGVVRSHGPFNFLRVQSYLWNDWGYAFQIWLADWYLGTLVHYCNSLYCKLPSQQIQNSLARTVVKAPKSCHITPILRSLHWLRITERIEYKLLSLTYKVPTTTQPPYLHNLISGTYGMITTLAQWSLLCHPYYFT